MCYKCQHASQNLLRGYIKYKKSKKKQLFIMIIASPCLNNWLKYKKMQEKKIENVINAKAFFVVKIDVLFKIKHPRSISNREPLSQFGCSLRVSSDHFEFNVWLYIFLLCNYKKKQI